MKPKYLMYGCSLTELGQCYFPLDQPGSALRALQRWIAKRPGLLEELTAMGYSDKGRQRLTPKMVEVIIHHLGDPVDGT